MNHILENTLVVTLLLLFLILPFYIASRRLKQQRRKKLQEIFHEQFEKYQLTLDRSAPAGERLLGWNAGARLLICVESVTTDPVLVDLKAASHCRISKIMLGDSVRTVALAFTDKQGKIVNELILYRQFIDNEMKLKQLLVQAAYWEEYLNGQFNGSC